MVERVAFGFIGAAFWNGSVLRSNTLKLMGCPAMGGLGLPGRFDAGFAQCPRGGRAMPAFRQALDSATSDMPISWASFRTGVSQALSNSSLGVKVAILCIDVIRRLAFRYQRRFPSSILKS